MTVIDARTGRPITLRFAHELFGRERVTIDDAVAGDIVGTVNATGVLVGRHPLRGRAQSRSRPSRRSRRNGS